MAGIVIGARVTGSGIGPSASASAIHSPTATVWGRRSRAIPTASSAASTRSGSIGSWRVSTLWSILRRSRNPAWTTRHSASSVAASSRSSGGNGSSTSTADSTLGAGSNASRGTRNATRALAWYWTNTDRYDMSPGRGRDSLGDLALEHQHQPVRTGRLARAGGAGPGS